MSVAANGAGAAGGGRVRRGSWKTLERDVLAEPKIGPVAGWVIGGLIALVAWLAWRFAQNGVPDAGGCSGPGCPAAATIPEAWGFVTIGLVSLLALVMGWEPIVRREWSRARWMFAGLALAAAAVLGAMGAWNAAPGLLVLAHAPQWMRAAWLRALATGLAAILAPVVLAASSWLAVAAVRIAGRAVSRAPGFIRAPLQGIGRMLVLWPSWLLSFVDWLFVRVIAVAAGVTLRSIWARYGALAAWLVGALLIALPDWPLGPAGIGVGLAVIFAVVRRWLWIEEDRVQFIVRRGRKLEDVQRIGFAQDLRDEALTVMVALAAFIPLGLRQGYLHWSWFTFTDPGTPGLLNWIGFFGAELAKAVPLVDWSEVFGVENGSPLQPADAEGAVAVFVLRATLDVLLIASVLQAFQIAAQLSEQRKAFDAGALDILDPFEERRTFDAAGKQTPVLSFLPLRRAGWVAWLAARGEMKGRGRARLSTPYTNGRLEEIAAAADGDAIQGDADGLRFALAGLSVTRPGPVARRLLADRDDPRTQAFMALLLAEAEGDAEASQALAKWVASFDPARLDWTSRDAALPAARALLAVARAKDPAAEKAADWAWALAAGQEADPEAALTLAYVLGGEGCAASLGGAADLFPERLRDAARAAMENGLPEAPGAFAAIRAGTEFWMGAPDEEEGRSDHEGPRHLVRFAHGFAIARFAVTFDEYDLYCDETGARRPPDFGWGRGRRPVVDVSWDDVCGRDGADGYLSWLNAKLGLQGAGAYRLPSEAEWEHACRAGKTTAFSSGDEVDQLGQHAWFSSNSGGQTHPVGEKTPNGLGLFDLHGNVWEWCQDVWHDYYDDAPTDGLPWEAGGDPSRRVLRGGSWFNYPGNCRSANRFRDNPTNRYWSWGFRLARTLSGF